MTGPRYILHPGPVKSRADGDRHYIGASHLLQLYGVPRGACIVIRPWLGELPLGFRELPDDVHLYPRTDGAYRLPAVAPAPLEHDECSPHTADFDLALEAGRLQARIP